MSTGIGVGISSVFTSRPAGGPSVVLEYSTSDYCETQTPSVITPTVIQPAPPAGVFTSSGSGLVVNPNSGVFNIGISNIGNYIITYTVAGVGSANFPVNISALDDSSFSYSASSYEPTDADPTPTITGLTGGTFSGTTGLVINSTTGEIDLSASTVATHTITYDTTSSGSSVCPNTSTQTVEIALAGIANNYSMNFDSASSDYIDAGNVLNFEYNQAFSISSWVNANAITGTKSILNKYDSLTTRGFLYSIYSNCGSCLHRINLLISNKNSGSTSGRKAIQLYTSHIIPLNNWNHVCITYDGGSLASGVNIYLNGVSQSFTVSRDTLGSNTILNTESLKIGGNLSYMDGKIDELAVWNTELTPTQVAEIYNATSTNLTKDLTTVSGSNLVYWNRMGD